MHSDACIGNLPKFEAMLDQRKQSERAQTVAVKNFEWKEIKESKLFVFLLEMVHFLKIPFFIISDLFCSHLRRKMPGKTFPKKALHIRIYTLVCVQTLEIL